MQQKITTDFYLACLLYAQNNIELVNHTRENNHSIFMFRGSNLESLVHEYETENAQVNLHDLARTIKKLKDIMYQTSTQPNNNIWNNTMTR